MKIGGGEATPPLGLILERSGGRAPKIKDASAPKASTQGRKAFAPAGGRGNASDQDRSEAEARKHAIVEGDVPGNLKPC